MQANQNKLFRVLFLCTGNSAKRAAFVDALTVIRRPVDLLLALRVEKLEKLILEAQVQAIGDVGTTATSAGAP